MYWRPGSTRTGRARPHRKWLLFSNGEADEAVAVEVDVEDAVAEVADPETVEAVSLKRRRQPGPKSTQHLTQDGQGQDILISRPSARARSTGTGGSLRGSARSHGRVLGRIFIASLPRIMDNNET